MADVLYTRGIPEWSELTTGTYRFLLLKGSGYTPNKDHDFVSDLVPASNEVTVSGYSRQTLASPTETFDDTNDRTVYDCADPSFGTLVAGETVSAMVLYRFVTNDADSILMAYYDLTDTPTAGTAFPVAINSSGLVYFDQA